METRNILNHLGEIIGELSLPEGTPEEIWTEKLSMYSEAPSSPSMNDIVKRKINDSEAFGKSILEEFTTENVLMGITQAGKTEAVTDYLHKLSHYIMTGSLYAAINEIDCLILNGLDPDLDPFITEERLTEYKKNIQRYLGLI